MVVLLQVPFRRDIQKSLLNGSIQKLPSLPRVRLGPSPELPNLEQQLATSPRARPLLRRSSAGSVLSPGQPRLVLRSDVGAPSDDLGVGPILVQLIRVGPGR